MAITHLTEMPREEATFAVTIAFTDDAGAAVVPSAATWTLTDANGVVVNSRSQVAIASLAASKTIVLSGDDLALLATYAGIRRQLLVEFTYTSSLGSGLPGKDAITFDIQSLVAVT